MNTIKKWTRSNFLNSLMSAGFVTFLISVFYPVFRYIIPPKSQVVDPDTISAGKVTELKPNSGRIVRFGRKPAIVIRTKTGDLKAFSAVCTHLDCTVQYRPDLQHIWCACHNGHYDLEGRNISGPPPKPLPQYTAGLNGEEIYITRSS